MRDILLPGLFPLIDTLEIEGADAARTAFTSVSSKIQKDVHSL